MAGKKDVLTKVLRKLGPKRVKEMDKSATSSMYDDLSELTAAEKRDLQKQLDKAKAKEADKKPKGKRTLEEVEADYTPAQRRALEKELDRLSRSSMEMNKGGMSKAKPAKKMMGGGMTKKYNVGGMAKSNCGASMKPNGGSRNK